MKRIIAILMVLALVLTLGSVTVFAEEADDGVTDGETVTEEILPSEGEGNVDFGARIVEAWERGDIIQVASLAVTGLMLLFVYLLKKGIKALGTAIVGVANKSSATVDAGVRSMEEASGKAEAKLSEYGEKIQASLDSVDKALETKLGELGERLKESTVKEAQIQQIEVLLVTLIKMFDNVYQHSKTIAATTKEQLAQDYNSVMKAYSTDVHMEEP